VNGFDSGGVSDGDELFWMEVKDEGDGRFGGGGDNDEGGGRLSVFLNSANDSGTKVLAIPSVESDEIRGEAGNDFRNLCRGR
jgi:hypothetical protein